MAFQVIVALLDHDPSDFFAAQVPEEAREAGRSAAGQRLLAFRRDLSDPKIASHSVGQALTGIPHEVVEVTQVA